MAASNSCFIGSEKPFFQRRVVEWLTACFSNEVCRDGIERNHRFLEEALELVQSLECTRSEAHQLVDYVFDRPVGVPMQELGGSLVTLVALANCHDMDVMVAGETELARVWTKIDAIRQKQAAKPKHSPLPQSVDAAQRTVDSGNLATGERENEETDSAYFQVEAVASPQEVQEACAQVADHTALRCVREQTPGDATATFIAKAIRALIPPAAPQPTTAAYTAPDISAILANCDELHDLGFKAGWQGAIEESAKIAAQTAKRCVREQTPGDSVAAFIERAILALSSTDREGK